MNKVVYHGTGKFIGESVELKPHYGRFGKAVYFSDIETAKSFGQYIYKKNISEPILEIKYTSLIDLCPNLSIDEEEGLTSLKELLEKKGYLKLRYVKIIYTDNSYELFSYYPEDVSLIEVKN